MNNLKTYYIPWKGLSKGVHHFDFELDDLFFKAFDDSEINGSSLSVSIELDKSATMMVLQVVIEGNVTAICDRCLGDVILPVEYDGELTVKFSDEINEYDGEIMWISQSEAELHLAQYLYESILLSLPYQKIHGEDENGNPLCDADMLSRFQIVSQDEFDAMEVEEIQTLGENPETEKLLELKRKMEEKD